MRMTKPTITKMFAGGVLAMVGGLGLAFAAVLISGMNAGFVMHGPDVVGLRGTALGWSMGTLFVVGTLTVVGGLIAQLVSWIGALINTARLTDKTWFAILLLTGVFSFGFVGMVGYVVAGPDGTESIAGLARLPTNPPRRA